MHLQMQHNVWLDNIINSRQYILRYTVGNPTSLRNVTFLVDKWIYAAGKRFYAAGVTGRLGITKYIFTVFLKGNVNSALEWG